MKKLCLITLFGVVLVSGCIQEKSLTTTTTSTKVTTTTTTPTTTSTTTALKIEVDLNFTTPELLINRTFFIADYYKVYINDSFLRIVDPNGTRGVRNYSIRAVKTAFSIWENETRMVQFKFVKPPEDYTLYVEWSGNMSTTLGGTQTIAYTVPYGYDCGEYFFITGGTITLSARSEDSQLAIMSHEIGHILNLADVGNDDSIMGQWFDENNIPSEEKLEKKIIQSVKDTLEMIIRPEYNCVPLA